MSDKPAGGMSCPPIYPAPGDVVWHRKFGFGLALDGAQNLEGVPVSTIDFGPHWGQRAIALQGGWLSSAPAATDVKARSAPVDCGAGFTAVVDPIVAAAQELPPTAGALQKALEAWEEDVSFIESGRVDVEDYMQYVAGRGGLERALSGSAMAASLPASVLSAALALDRRFCSVTSAAGLCVWHFSCPFQVIDNWVGIRRDWYDPGRFWYYYRWPAEDAAVLQGHDVFSWQKQAYGLDFLHMSEQQLRERVLVLAQQARPSNVRK